jgi:hypothetical protein
VIKTLGKSSLECASEAWKDFIDTEQMEDETIRKFVLRFELTEANLRTATLIIPSNALAMQLLMKSKLSSMFKENVLSKVNLDDDRNLNFNIKKTLRELKSLTQSKTDKVEKETVVQEQEILEIKQETSPRMERKSRYSERYERDSRRMADEISSKRDYKYIPKDWKSRANVPEGWRVKEKKPHMNTVSYTASTDNIIHKEFELTCVTEDELKECLIETVYQEGNIDVDPYNAVIDTGCPKTV